MVFQMALQPERGQSRTERRHAMDQLKDNIRIFSEADTDVLSRRTKNCSNRSGAYTPAGSGSAAPAAGIACRARTMSTYLKYSRFTMTPALSPWTEFGKTFYSLVAVSNDRDASKCTGCRLCENSCPQRIPVAARLREAHEAMKPEQD